MKNNILNVIGNEEGLELKKASDELTLEGFLGFGKTEYKVSVRTALYLSIVSFEFFIYENDSWFDKYPHVPDAEDEELRNINKLTSGVDKLIKGLNDTKKSSKEFVTVTSSDKDEPFTDKELKGVSKKQLYRTIKMIVAEDMNNGKPSKGLSPLEKFTSKRTLDDINITLKHHTSFLEKETLSMLKKLVSTVNGLSKLYSEEVGLKDSVTTESDTPVFDSRELNVSDFNTFLNKDIENLDGYCAILTTENAYVDKIKPFFADGVAVVSNKLYEFSNVWFRDQVFKSRSKELMRLNKDLRTIESIEFFKVRKMHLPIPLGMSGTYYENSSKFETLVEDIEGLRKSMKSFHLYLQDIMAEGSEKRLKLHAFPTMDLHDSSNTFKDKIDSMITSKSMDDTKAVEELIPNMTTVAITRDNYRKVCDELTKTNAIGLMQKDLVELTETVKLWSKVVKSQDNTRHSKNVIYDIKEFVGTLAKATTHMGTAIALLDQQTIFFIKGVDKLKSKA